MSQQKAAKKKSKKKVIAATPSTPAALKAAAGNGAPAAIKDAKKAAVGAAVVKAIGADTKAPGPAPVLIAVDDLLDTPGDLLGDGADGAMSELNRIAFGTAASATSGTGGNIWEKPCKASCGGKVVLYDRSKGAAWIPGATRWAVRHEPSMITRALEAKREARQLLARTAAGKVPDMLPNGATAVAPVPRTAASAIAVAVTQATTQDGSTGNYADLMFRQHNDMRAARGWKAISREVWDSKGQPGAKGTKIDWPLGVGAEDLLS